MYGVLALGMAWNDALSVFCHFDFTLLHFSLIDLPGISQSFKT